ncbi:semaphorin-1A-like [Diadema setosum]|uniref:semaphorin-1A-like n=1 Tax=Diadema setosum TaxID=31175 RepID=UPI003B3B7AE1
MELRAKTDIFRHQTLNLLAFIVIHVCFVAGITEDTVFVARQSQNVTDVQGLYYYPAETNAPDAFYRILDVNRDHVLVGGKNSYTELHRKNLELVMKVNVPRVQLDSSPVRCEDLLRGREYYCHNYVTFVLEVNDTTSIFCGTNALFPRCVTSVNGTIGTSWEGKGLTASSPDQSTTTLASLQGENLVVFSGAPTKREFDFAISRTTVRPDRQTESMVRTDTDNSNWIEGSSAPHFVGDPIEYNGKMYFFFREEASEASNVEKIVYSRVAQVCVNDTGGTTGILTNKWTTFLKARLSCSTVGDFNVYFNNLQSIYRSKDNPYILFGVFTMPSAGISASALCAYDLREIARVFETASFKWQENSASLWLNVPASDVPTPRPGTCATVQPTTNYQKLARIQLMSTMVPNKADYDQAGPRADPTSDYPIMIVMGQQLQRLVVQEKGVSGLDTDIFFFGTDKGHILKAYVEKSSENNQPRIVENIMLKIGNSTQNAINVMEITSNGSTIYASTSSRIYRLPTANCGRFDTCVKCVEGLDPACSWVVEGEPGCRASTDGIQDLINGDTTLCPVPSSTTTSQTIPATPVGESTIATSAPSEQTTDEENPSTPKPGQPQTGTSTESMGTSHSPPLHSPTTSPPPRRITPSKTSQPPPPPQPNYSTTTEFQPINNTTMNGPDPVCDRPQANVCYTWIITAIILVCFCNIPACITLVYCCRQRKLPYSPSRPIKR